MPTAGEYKHEPFGIPCHCYVRRRLHHTPSKKSCLRKHSDTSSQHSDSKSKHVTFNPILNVRSYSETSAEPVDSRKHSKDHAQSRESVTLCDKLKSFLRLNRSTVPGIRQNCNRKSHHRGRKDYNNNIVDGKADMNAERDCPICIAKRNLSPIRGPRYGRARERTPSPCAFHQPYPPRVAKNGSAEAPQYQYATTSDENNAAKFNRAPTPHPARYHSPRRLFRQDSSDTESSRTQFRSPDSSLEYENMDTLNNKRNGSVKEENGVSVQGKPNAYSGAKSDHRLKPISIPIPINDDGEEDKMDEYIYEIPINNTDKGEKEYEYISIKSLERTHPQLDPYPSKYVPSNFDAVSHSSSLLVRHTTETDLTYGTYRKRLETSSPQSDADPKPGPYDIKFLHQRSPSGNVAYQQEIEVRDETANSQGNVSDVNFCTRRTIKQFSPLADILWMTPVALFWTGCAFLVAMVCAFLFPCDHC